MGKRRKLQTLIGGKCCKTVPKKQKEDQPIPSQEHILGRTMGLVQRDKALHIYKKKGVVQNPDVWSKYQSLATTFDDQIGQVSPPKTANLRHNRRMLNESSLITDQTSILTT